MPTEKVARIVSGTSTFIPEGASEGVVLAYQQNITLTRSSDNKELLANDVSLEETVLDLETKVSYELTTEIADLNLDNLGVAFKGLVTEKTYKKDDVFITGKTIKAIAATNQVGDLVISGDRIYVTTKVPTSTAFNADNYAAKSYAATVKSLTPDVRPANFGSLVVEGINQATNKPQILHIPKINLGFDGDLAISGTDYAKVSLKGKLIKVDGKSMFELMDL